MANDEDETRIIEAIVDEIGDRMAGVLKARSKAEVRMILGTLRWLNDYRWKVDYSPDGSVCYVTFTYEPEA